MFANTNRLSRRSPIIIFAILTSWIISGISFAEIGKIHINNKVAAGFEAYQANPNYSYYFANQENNPCAIIGLRKDYKVDDILWTKVRPDSDDFKKVIELVKRFPMSSSPAFGAYILDSKGNTIGEYYSSGGAGVTVNKEMKSILLTIFMSGSHHN